MLSMKNIHASEGLKPKVFIKAFNPGFSIEGKSNVGEFIELINLSKQSSISLAGFSLRYTNSSGKSNSIFEFPEGSQMVGETLLLKLSSSPDSSAADLNYTRTIALDAGPLELVYFNEVLDTVCWNGTEKCLPKFSSSQPRSAVRDFESNKFNLSLDYLPKYDTLKPGYLPPKTAEESQQSSICKGIIFSEILTYYELDKSEQYIELFNPKDEIIKLDGCSIRYRNKTYSLSGEVDSSGFFVYQPKDFTLTKNPSASSKIELLDADSEVIDSTSYPNGQRKSASFALFDYDQNGNPRWLVTFQPTPGSKNIFQEFKTCPTGKVLNESTGNCVKALSMKSALSDCPSGKYRNPLTGRCIKYNTKTSITTCKDGYEINPETGRCRKIKNNTGAGFSLNPQMKEEGNVFIAFGAILIIVAIALIYGIYQFRSEIIKFFKNLHQKLFKSK